MRKIVFALLLFGCGSDGSSRQAVDAGVGGGPEEEVALLDDGGPDAAELAQPNSDDLVITNVDRFGYGTGDIEEVAGDTTGWRVEAVSNGDTFAGVRAADGSFVISGVPRGAYVLRVTRRESEALATDPERVYEYPADTYVNQGRVRFGGNHWAHAAEASDDTTNKLGLDVAAPASFTRYDRLSLVSLSSYYYRSFDFIGQEPSEPPFEDQTNVPAEGALSSSGWTIDSTSLEQPYGVEASGLPQATDDLTLTQLRERSINIAEPIPYTPWSRTRITSIVGMLDASGRRFRNGATNTIPGTLQAPPTEQRSLGIDGLSFQQLRIDGKYPENTVATARFTLNTEAGAGPELFTSVGFPYWTASAATRTKPVDPWCYTPSLSTIPCDAGCLDTCNSDVSGSEDPGILQYTFETPKVAGDDMRDLLYVSYNYNWKSGFYRPLVLSATATRVFPSDKAPEQVELALSAVQNLDIGVVWESEAQHQGPLNVSFEAPAMGTPDSYLIEVIELRPDLDPDTEEEPEGGGRTVRTVARYVTRSTSLTVPATVFRDEHMYYVRVTATTEVNDYSEPEVYPTDTYDSTALFSPPFRFVEG